MEGNERPQGDQSQEVLDKAAKRRQLEERRAAYYEERARKLEEEQRRAKEAAERAKQAKQKMITMMKQQKMARAA